MRILMLIMLACLMMACEPVKEYNTTVIESKGKAEALAKTVDMDSLKKSITTFEITNDRYPADIKELSAISGIELDPAKYDYNPATGSISTR